MQLANLLNYSSAILGLGILIFVHELGHFLAAKACGVGVHRFSIGFGPATPLRFKRGVTEYVVAWIPLGGFVKMASKEEQEEMSKLEGAPVDHEFPADQLFENKSLAARALVLSAGVIMNVLTAWVIYGGMAGVYGRSELATTVVERVEASTLPEGAAALVQLEPGRAITAFAGREIATWNNLVDAVLDSPAGAAQVVFADGGPVEVTLAEDPEARRALARSLVPRIPARIGEVVPGEPAARGGLESGDVVVAVDGQEVTTWEALVGVLEGAAGRELSFTVERGGEQKTLAITPKTAEVPDPVTGETKEVGRVGITSDPPTVKIEIGFGEAVVEGWQRTWRSAGMIGGVLRGLVFGQISARELGGPIAIVQMSTQAARQGLDYLLGFWAFLSVNLAILNLLPIPALDGGQLLFLVAEGVRGGKPLPLEWRYRLLNFGVLLLLLLMVFVFGNDIVRLVFGR